LVAVTGGVTLVAVHFLVTAILAAILYRAAKRREA
jgi:hypothetical protein